MTENKFHSGIDYSLRILQDNWQPTLVFWLGFRPLTLDELHQLVPKLSGDDLKAELAKLQNLRIANPVKDTDNCYSLTEDGDDFRQLMISLRIWGKQQMNDDENKVSPLIVEPEADAKLSELIKYNKFLREYINYDE
ncbi:MAG: winged helix-turn-helix transcriptional regulator [Limosilactobacillus pontis]|uniref:HxlR family transcriptional regulator n=1 Tax=Limosilactobacillus pontis TaxID=35787 RepID=A0A2J6NQ27_9LACO|nr:winged helix-turn-helix transcriptional regulator [Limosilactobacillus pontis]PMB83366.1 HxlR family transcriptional regulator [Limosilactobacillus pontis]